MRRNREREGGGIGTGRGRGRREGDVGEELLMMNNKDDVHHLVPTSLLVT